MTDRPPPVPLPGGEASRTGAELMHEPIHHVPSRLRRGAPTPRMAINLGPMIDVIFNLLIYFVVTANFAVSEGALTLQMPQGSGAPDRAAPPPSPLHVAIGAVDDTGVRITVQNQTMEGSFERLYERLAELQLNEGNPSGAYRPDDPIIIRPDGRVRWQHVMNAFNAAVRANYSNISFARAGQ